MQDSSNTSLWDSIVIGTGMGGAPLGLALAQAGQRVLFLERGRSHLSHPEALRGDYAEAWLKPLHAPRETDRETLARAGRWFEEISDLSPPRPHRHLPFVGCGSGGSSALYGMAMERLFPFDLTPGEVWDRAEIPNVPERWPIGWNELRPYYRQAERLFEVKGTADPLKGDSGPTDLPTPPPLTPGNAELSDYLAGRNLHPYRLPLACTYAPGCPGCQGFLCPGDCKRDAASACLAPALSEQGATLLDECEVRGLKTDGQRVTEVVARRHGKEMRFKGGLVVLAAGALQTPALLLRSSPAGLGNRNGLVGRFLMRHCIDLYALEPKYKGPLEGNVKEISFNDLYLVEGEKLGTVQSFGRLPQAPILVESMQGEIAEGPMPWLAPAFSLTKPLLRPMLDRMFNRRLILAAIMEDLPYTDNRVTLDGDRVAIHYRLGASERRRIVGLRRRMRDILGGYSFQLLKQAENNARIAHACGTCRFGEDPARSVLDPNCRLHDLNNLYVVDASIFPTSGGTNPSLTIAANALRVADHIIGEG